jgi:hypothetical protein
MEPSPVKSGSSAITAIPADSASAAVMEAAIKVVSFLIIYLLQKK